MTGDVLCRNWRVRVVTAVGIDNRMVFRVQRRRLLIWWTLGTYDTEAHAANDANLFARALDNAGREVWPTLGAEED